MGVGKASLQKETADFALWPVSRQRCTMLAAHAFERSIQRQMMSTLPLNLSTIHERSSSKA